MQIFFSKHLLRVAINMLMVTKNVNHVANTFLEET